MSPDSASTEASEHMLLAASSFEVKLGRGQARQGPLQLLLDRDHFGLLRSDRLQAHASLCKALNAPVESCLGRATWVSLSTNGFSDGNKKSADLPVPAKSVGLVGCR